MDNDIDAVLMIPEVLDDLSVNYNFQIYLNNFLTIEMFVRLAKVKDCQEIYELISTGDSGMTTLPKSKEQVLERINWSKRSLNKKIKSSKRFLSLF